MLRIDNDKKKVEKSMKRVRNDMFIRGVNTKVTKDKREWKRKKEFYYLG